MHLYKRGKIWWIEFVKDGVKYRQTTHTTKKAEATAWMNAIKTARKMPTFEQAVEVLRMLYKEPAQNTLPLEAAWSAYESLAGAIGKLAGLSDKTLIDRRRRLSGLVSWIERNAATIRTVEGVSGQIAAKYAEYLATMGKSTKTRRNIIGDLSTIWTALEKRSDGIKNPWKDLAPADIDRKRILNFSAEQERAVLAAAKKVGKDWFPACVIARHTGLRYGDVARLTWDEVDLERGIIRRKPKKTERFGISVELPIIAPIREALEALPRLGDFLFPLHAELYGKKGKNVQKALSFREVLDAAGISGNYTFHSWRHTAATRLAEAGADVETRKRILGHTTDENAARYDHAAHAAEDRAALEAAAN
jgi:integrase